MIPSNTVQGHPVTCMDSKQPSDPVISDSDRVVQTLLEQTSDGIFIAESWRREPVTVPETNHRPGTFTRNLLPDKFCLVITNPIYRRLFSLADGIDGKPLHHCFPPEIAQLTHHYLHRCWELGQSLCYEQGLHSDTGVQTVLTTLSPIVNAEGAVIKILGVCQNLSERRQMQAASQLVQTITLAIADAENFEVALGVVLTNVCQAMFWDYGEAWVPNQESTAIQLAPSWYGDRKKLGEFRQLREQLIFPTSSSLIGQIWSVSSEFNGEIIPEPDGSLLRVDMAMTTGFQAGLSMPILANGEILAVLVFFMYEDRIHDQRLISLMSTTSVQLGIVIHHKKYRNIFENVVAGIYQIRWDGRYQAANPMLARIYGYQSPQDLMRSITNVAQQLYVEPERGEQFRELLAKQDTVCGFESQVYRQDGQIIWIAESGRVIRNGAGELIAYEGTVEDISRRKQAEAKLHERDSLLQGIATAMHYLLTDTDYQQAIIKALAALGVATNVERVYIYESHPHPDTGESALSLRFEWSKQGQPTIDRPDRQNLTLKTFGLSEWPRILDVAHSIANFPHSLPHDLREILEQEGLLSRLIVPIAIEAKFWGYLGFDDDTSGQSDLGFVNKQWRKSRYPGRFDPKLKDLLCLNSSPRRWSDSEISILMVIAESIGGALQRQKLEAMMRHEAFHDRLTGLPNRALLEKKLNTALKNAENKDHPVAVMFMDLDHFKVINDTLGHAIGDQLLQSVAQRLQHCLREGDTVARWGGDEFVLVLPYIHCRQDAAKVAGRLLGSLSTPFKLSDYTLVVASSLGIAIYPDDGKEVEELINRADTALYQAKQGGRNKYEYYQEKC